MPMSKRAKSKKERRLTASMVAVCVAAAVAVLGAGFIVYKELELERKNKIVRPEDLPYREEVIAAEAAYGVEQPRIYAVIQVESSFIPDAVSKAGAIGLMQMLPSTYKDQCARRGVPCDPEDLCKPEVSIDFCSEYLMLLHDLTGSWKWAHIAYSKGIGNVLRWQEEGYTPETVPSDEARRYLDRIEAAYDAYTLIFRAAEEHSNETNANSNT